jgi:putative SOS response-associated peptidase YedK
MPLARRQEISMCGRFTLMLPWSEIIRLYRLTLDFDIGRNTAPRSNIAPTQDVLFVHLNGDGHQTVSDGRWWLVPFWALMPTIRARRATRFGQHVSP